MQVTVGMTSPSLLRVLSAGLWEGWKRGITASVTPPCEKILALDRVLRCMKRARAKLVKSDSRHNAWPTPPQLPTRLPATANGLLGHSETLQTGGGDVPDLPECQLPLQGLYSGDPPPSLTLAGNLTRFHACLQKTHLLRRSRHLKRSNRSRVLPHLPRRSFVRSVGKLRQ